MIFGPHPQFRAWIKPSWLPKIALDDPPEGFEHPCRLWLGARTSDGYPAVHIGGRKGKVVYLHRWALEQYLGAPLGEYEADHLCRRRNCFEESHLEKVTRAVNTERSTFWLYNRPAIALSPEDLASLADWSWVLIARRYA